MKIEGALAEGMQEVQEKKESAEERDNIVLP